MDEQQRYREARTALEAAAMELTARALNDVRRLPPNTVVAPWVVLVREDGQVSPPLPIDNTAYRVELISAMVKANAAIGFAFVYDGYVTELCPSCHESPVSTCETCHGRPVEKRDAILTVVRMKDGQEVTSKVLYRRTPTGVEIEAGRRLEVGQGMFIMDVYKGVFQQAPDVVN